jgi:hypothetical protein
MNNLRNNGRPSPRQRIIQHFDVRRLVNETEAALASLAAQH